MLKIIRLSKVDSTQNFAKKIADKANDNTVVISDIQTRGRGRFERTWSSQKGGLYFSIILKPRIKLNEIFILTYQMALAVLDSLSKYSEIKLKWPNDVIIKDKKQQKYRKICGILTESSIRRNKLNWVIIGVGIDINNTLPKSLRNIAISLKEIIKKDTSLELVFAKVIKNFNNYYNNYTYNKTIRKYKTNLAIPNENITFIYNNNKYIGKISKVRNDGGLELILPNQITKIFYSGNIILP